MICISSNLFFFFTCFQHGITTYNLFVELAINIITTGINGEKNWPTRLHQAPGSLGTTEASVPLIHLMPCAAWRHKRCVGRKSKTWKTWMEEVSMTSWRIGGIQTWFVYGKSHEKRWFGGRPMTSETSKWSSDQVHFKVENNRAWRAISINSLLSYACMLGLGGPHPWWNRRNCDCFGAGSGMNQQL